MTRIDPEDRRVQMKVANRRKPCPSVVPLYHAILEKQTDSTGDPRPSKGKKSKSPLDVNKSHLPL